MGKNDFRRVVSGEPLVIPASTYNAMLDAAEANRNRRMTLAPNARGFDTLFIHIANDTGKELKKYDVVGLDAPLDTIESGGNIVFSGVVPKKKHKGKFAILQSDASQTEVVRACVHGVTFARLKEKDGASRSDPASKKPKSCDIIEGDTTSLKPSGNAEVLWNEDGWAIIRIGGGGKQLVFPVRLEKSGGEAGTDSKPTTWKYTVFHALDDDEIEKDVDPTKAPHQWKRPTIGQMTAATFGYAHYNEDDKLVVGWVNETLVLEACDDKPPEDDEEE